jgi:hypothetical protein
VRITAGTSTKAPPGVIPLGEVYGQDNVANRGWSEMQECPDCHQETLRMFWVQIAEAGTPKLTDEFCDNPGCTRGDRPGPVSAGK